MFDLRVLNRPIWPTSRYVGEVDGDAEYRSAEVLSRLRRPVRWDNAGQGVDFADLPATLSAKLQSPHELLDLTAQLSELWGLVDRNEAAASVATFVLPDVRTDELLIPLLAAGVRGAAARPAAARPLRPTRHRQDIPGPEVGRHLAGTEGTTLV